MFILGLDFQECTSLLWQELSTLLFLWKWNPFISSPQSFHKIGLYPWILVTLVGSLWLTPTPLEQASLVLCLLSATRISLHEFWPTFSEFFLHSSRRPWWQLDFLAHVPLPGIWITFGHLLWFSIISSSRLPMGYTHNGVKGSSPVEWEMWVWWYHLIAMNPWPLLTLQV